MIYVDGSGELSSTESTTLDGLSTGAVPVKTTTGFATATQDNVPNGTTAKQYNPAAIAMTGGTSTDVLSSDTVTSGAAVLAGACVGPAPTTQKWSAASAASGSSPGICGGVAVAAVGATDLPLKVQDRGITGIIADALWDTLPATSDVDKDVFMSKTAGHYTLDVSAYTTTDRVQSVGILHAGGTGACRIKLAIGKGMTAAQYAAIVALATQAANTITGNNTGAPAVAVGLTVAQIKTLLAYVAPDLSLDALKRGTAIADSSITIHPGTDKVSQYMANAGIFTTNRTTTVDGAGTPVRGHVVWLTRYDVSANTWTIADSALGTIIVMPASTAMAVAIVWNGANWGNAPAAVQYL